MSERLRGRRRKGVATVARDAGKRKQRSLVGTRGRRTLFFLILPVFCFRAFVFTVFVFGRGFEREVRRISRF